MALPPRSPLASPQDHPYEGTTERRRSSIILPAFARHGSRAGDANNNFPGAEWGTPPSQGPFGALYSLTGERDLPSLEEVALESTRPGSASRAAPRATGCP